MEREEIEEQSQAESFTNLSDQIAQKLRVRGGDMTKSPFSLSKENMDYVVIAASGEKDELDYKCIFLTANGTWGRIIDRNEVRIQMQKGSLSGLIRIYALLFDFDYIAMNDAVNEEIAKAKQEKNYKFMSDRFNDFIGTNGESDLYLADNKSRLFANLLEHMEQASVRLG